MKKEKEIIIEKDGVEYTAKVIAFEEVYTDGTHPKAGLKFKGFTGKQYGQYYINNNPIFEDEKGELFVVVD